MSDIREWLHGHDLGQLAEAFEAEQIDFDALLELEDGDLREMGLPIGPRKKVLKAIRELSAPKTEAPEAAPAPDELPIRSREAERRQITVMFCDLVGSTALSEQLDPEDLRALMQAYQQAAGGVIERYEGHVAQYLGDGLMTYFGWPQAHEDDAERAVRAGIDIVEAIKEVDSPLPLQVRVGIATGPVVVGETGAGDASVPKLAVGETPNLAARLQSLAGSDEIVVGPSTRRLFSGTFELEDLGEQSLKGIVEPIRAYRIARVAATEGRFEAHHQHLTPLVGREAEMAMVMARWEQVKAGEGQVIVLGGEPGIGKSRITQTLRERLADEPHTRLRYQCSPYHTSSALHPVIEQLERAAGFDRDDTSDQKLDKLEALLSPSASGTDRALFASLLSLPIERYPPLAMSPQKQKEETLRALTDEVMALATAQPVLLIFEDAHWIDPTTQDVLNMIVPAVAEHAVLAVITHRPEYEPPWLGQGHVTPLVLSRLGRADAKTMVARLFDAPLSDDMLDQIVAKTDGVPLFVEELTKTVVESGADMANAIPETLQDSLMARLDRLSPIKEVAQIGACIGREFPLDLLSAVSPLSDNELGDALQQLLNSELIYGNSANYVFKHALVQDSAYQSLLKSRRRQIHSRIAESIESLFPERAELEPEISAHHYAEAGLFEASTRKWLAAGRLALGRYALEESIEHLQKGLNDISSIAESNERDDLEVELRLSLGSAYLGLFGWPAPELRDALEPAYPLIEASDDGLARLSAGWLLSVHYGCHCEFGKSQRYIDDMISFGTSRNDSSVRLIGHMAAVYTEMWQGKFASGQEHYEAVKRLYSSKDHAHLVTALNHDPLDAAAGWNGIGTWIRGFPDQARSLVRQQLASARQNGHPFNHAFCLWTACFTWHFTGDYPEMGVATREMLKVGRDQAIPIVEGVLYPFFHGEYQANTGLVEEGLSEIQQACSTWMNIGGQIQVPLLKKMIASAQLKLGQVDDALSQIDEGIEIAEGTGHHAYLADVYRVKGDIFAYGSSDKEKASAEYFRALGLARTQGAKSWELRSATSLARLWQGEGRTREAYDLLAPVYDWFTEGFDTADLKDAKALLSELGRPAAPDAEMTG